MHLQIPEDLYSPMYTTSCYTSQRIYIVSSVVLDRSARFRGNYYLPQTRPQKKAKNESGKGDEGDSTPDAVGFRDHS